MKTLPTQPYKGTRDFYPEDYRIQKWMFDQMREAVLRFGYEEYEGPMLESFETYAAKTGEEIVKNQLYWFEDRGKRKVAMRPEMTPTLARMVAGRFLELPQPIRYFSIPNLWRYEKPQRGRLREHWQLNVDVLGGDPLLADAEILEVAFQILKQFNGESSAQIHLNHRGLMDFFFENKLGLTHESALEVTKAIDARAKIGEEKFKAWILKSGVPEIKMNELLDFFKSDFNHVVQNYSCPAVDHLKRLFSLLDKKGMQGQYVFDPTIMRGADYYTGTVFEIYDLSPENNRAMFGGGRYDNLIGLFGKNQLSGIGFGMGDVTLRNFLETHQLLPKMKSPYDIFITLPSETYQDQHELFARQLRKEGLNVLTPLSVGSFKQQLKLASKWKVPIVLLFGESEFEKNQVILKNMEKGDQQTVDFSSVTGTVKQWRTHEKNEYEKTRL